MKLEKYISDLLYRYDLVIVPGFGGFLSRRKPARFNKDTYVFSPPYKELSFNAQLKSNDGLLADYLASEEGISYNDAVDKISLIVSKWKEVLQKEKRIKLEQIGIFSWLDEEKLVFMPLTTRNYLTESFGLTSYIHSPSVDKKLETTDIELNKNQENRVVVTKKQVLDHSFFLYHTWKYVALLVLALFVGGIILLNNKGGEIETYQKATFILQKDFPAIQLGKTSEKQAENKILPKSKLLNKHFIISGAFRSKNNALKKMKDLANIGYKAQLVGKNKRGLWMVAYEGFSQKNDAKKKLEEIKKIQKTAWIFSKK